MQIWKYASNIFCAIVFCYYTRCIVHARKITNNGIELKKKMNTKYPKL